MIRLSVLFPAILSGMFSFASAGAGPRVNRALSASFSPLQLRVVDPAVRARLAVLLRNQSQDSTAWAVWDGDELRISADLAVRLGAFSDTTGSFRVRVRRALENLSGPGIEENEVLVADAYYPNDSLFFSAPQWPLYNSGVNISGTPGKAGVDIGMTRVWEKYDGDDSLVVAVLDAGFNFKHPELQGRWYRNMAEVNGTPGADDDHNGVVDDTAGWDFVDNDNSAQDYEGHGTITGGLIAANFDNGKGIAGMIPRVRILPVRVLNAAGQGSVNNIAAGIQYAVKMHVSAINFSISGGWTSTAMRTAFQAARDSGIPIIAAAGNDHINLDSIPMTPSSYGFDNVYMVAAHINDATIAGFSNYGATTVPLAAPGDAITTTDIPANILVYSDNFDAGISNWSFAATSDFVSSTATPLQGTTTLQWSAGVNTWAATVNNIDLTGKVGSTVSFMLDYTPASTRDELLVEGQRQGSTTWTTFAIITSAVSRQTLAFDMHAMDGAPFKLRFRTLATTGTVPGRILRLDDVRVYCVDLSPQNQNAYIQTGGTSVAAPYMTGYIGLLRTACKRTNTPFTRALALAASTPEAVLTGKVSTGGRLDVAKGLAFYLNTLPGLAVTDSTRVSWTSGDTVKYSLSVPGASASAYAFKDITTLTGSALTAAGKFSWNSTSAATGKDTVRFRAEGSPLVLRKMTAFTLVPKIVSLSDRMRREPEAMLWIGEKAFVLPRTFFDNPSHVLRVESVDADGRSRPVFSGNVETPFTSGKTAYQLPGLTGVGWKVWVDGVALAAQPVKSTP